MENLCLIQEKINARAERQLVNDFDEFLKKTPMGSFFNSDLLLIYNDCDLWERVKKSLLPYYIEELTNELLKQKP